MARSRLEQARDFVSRGLDPGAERKSLEQTFENVARRWYARRMENRRRRYAHYVLRRLEPDVFPEIDVLYFPELLHTIDTCVGAEMIEAWTDHFEAQRKMYEARQKAKAT